MLLKVPTGTTAENNALTLPEGFISIDSERKAIRIHDGVTQGGFEALGRKAKPEGEMDVNLIELLTVEPADTSVDINSIELTTVIEAQRELDVNKIELLIAVRDT